MFIIFIIPLIKIPTLSNRPYIDRNAVILNTTPLNNKCINGVYIGSENVFTNCTSVCKIKSAKYIYVNENDQVYNSRGEKINKGGWCVAQPYKACNTELARVVQNKYSWDCIAKYPLVDGYGNIIKCNGRIKDSLKNIIYEGKLPLNFKFETSYGFDELLEDGVTYRYTCANLIDQRGNDYVAIPNSDRFETAPNYCKSLIPNAPREIQMIIDDDSIKCKCHTETTNLINLYDNENLPCAIKPLNKITDLDANLNYKFYQYTAKNWESAHSLGSEIIPSFSNIDNEINLDYNVSNTSIETTPIFESNPTRIRKTLSNFKV